MKLKLYHDTRKKFRDCVDAWTIYVPYPKWLREKTCGTMGTFLGCTPTETGMIRCIWEHDERRCGRPYFGKKIDPKDTPKAFQEIFYNMEKLWNEAITKSVESMERSLKLVAIGYLPITKYRKLWKELHLQRKAVEPSTDWADA
jgi:hypothetical protein